MEVFSLSEKKINLQVYNEIGHTAMKSYRLFLIKEVWILKPRDLGAQTRVYLLLLRTLYFIVKYCFP